MVGWEEVYYGDKVSKDMVIYFWLLEKVVLDCVK